MTEEKIAKASALAEKIIKTAENSLLLNMRFLARALGSLGRRTYDGSIGTDSRNIFYSPMHIISRFKAGEKLIAHDWLHMLMHCVFRHWHTGFGVVFDIWDTACDIAAEAILLDLDIPFCGNEKTEEKRAIIREISSKTAALNAESIYSYFMKTDISQDRLTAYSAVFSVDDHSIWQRYSDVEYEPEEKQDTIGIPEQAADEDGSDKDDSPEQNGENGGDEDDDGENTQTAEDGSKEADGNNGTDDGDGSGDAPSELGDDMLEKWNENNKRLAAEQLEKQWQEIAKQIQSELEHFDKNAGTKSEGLVRALADINREKYDYTQFLKKFAVRGEIMRPDPEAFDRNFYSYGLELYENVALIEPLEYKETKRIRDLVIAIDTSGSVGSALVQSFVRKTYNILKNENSFFGKTNIYIIQCDTEIREAVKLGNKREFEKYIAEMELKGLGGTDFRPVFEYVNALVEKKELTRLKGLIYFTDGYGTFPAKKPPYETAFVFMKSDADLYGKAEVPPWAIKVVLNDGDIR